MSKVKDRIRKRSAESAEFREAGIKEGQKLDLADLLFDLRNETGLKQTEFARKVNKPRSTIARIENATMEPSVKLMNEIANSLNKEIKLSIVEKEDSSKVV